MIERLHFAQPRDRAGDDLYKRINDGIFAAWRAELERREAIIEDFLISGAMMRDLVQVVQKVQKVPFQFVRFDWPDGPVEVDPIGETWRLT